MSLRENNVFIMRLERTINFGMFIGRLKLITTFYISIGRESSIY
jgi:hypothetical protein